MNSALSIGNFDGLHIGHRKLLSSLAFLARERDLRSVVVTYDNLPAQYLNNHSRPLLLMPAEQKKQGILGLGIDEVRVLHFDEKLAQTSAEDFLHGFIMPRLTPEIIVVGYDSHFGHKRQGDYDFLLRHARDYGYDLHYVEPLFHAGRVVSSTLVRNLLLEGGLEVANELLAAPYALYGKVVPSSGIGRQLGFPTANIELAEPNQLVPQTGVYLSRVRLEAEEFFGLTNIGSGPTLGKGGAIAIETFVIDFSGQLYGREMSVELIKYLREEKLFPSRDELIKAINEDLLRARTILEAGL
ncbi:MAG: bifunctional riboflavin kinase/FAD synthetase [Candidatus Syntrophosphaera sp.]